MAPKRDSSRRSTDRKPSLGGNLVWSLLAAGVAGLFAISLIGSPTQLKISYSDLQRLVRASTAVGESRYVSISEGAGPGTAALYGYLHDVVIGAYEVAGKVREFPSGRQVDQEPAPPLPGMPAVAAGIERRFTTAKLPSETSEAELKGQLNEHKVSFSYEDPPSPWRSWMPMLLLTGLFGLLFFLMIRRLG